MMQVFMIPIAMILQRVLLFFPRWRRGYLSNADFVTQVIGSSMIDGMHLRIKIPLFMFTPRILPKYPNLVIELLGVMKNHFVIYYLAAAILS